MCVEHMMKCVACGNEVSLTRKGAGTLFCCGKPIEAVG